jgi:hypothetical protein
MEFKIQKYCGKIVKKPYSANHCLLSKPKKLLPKLEILKKLKHTTTTNLKYIAIQFLYMVTFGLASLAKWSPGGIPEGFTNRFGDTWMALLPGALVLPYYTIAISETLIFALFFLSLFRLEWLNGSDKMYMRLGLILSLFVFVILSYGLRLTGDFGGAANTFFYFGVTLFALYLTEKETTAD